MHIVFLNGNEVKGSWQDFMRALWHPLFVALILCMACIIFLLGPYDHILPDDTMARFLIVFSSIGVYLATAVFCVAQSRRWAFLVFSFPVLMSSVMVTSLWGVSISVVAGGNGLDGAKWAQLIAFNIVFCVVGEVVLASFLLTRIATETGLQTHAPKRAAAPLRPKIQPETSVAVFTPPSPPLWAEVLGEKLALASIWHLKAEEHYVSVGLKEGRSLLLRGRLADAIAQLPPDSGMQIHRSHWVAKDAVRDVFRAREGWRLRLVSGQDVPVARNRTVPVRAWVQSLLQAT